MTPDAQIYRRADSGTMEREFIVSFDADEDRGDMSAWLGVPLRELTVTLDRSQQWPAHFRRGRSIEYEVMGHRFVGVIKWRRLHKLVCLGEFQ